MTRALAWTALALVAGCSGARDPADHPDARVGVADAAPADAAPGAPDADPDRADAGPRVTPLINELMRKPPDGPGGGEEHEFIEIRGSRDTDYSDYWILQVRGQGTAEEIGQVRTAAEVGTTDANGYWSTGYLTDVYKNNTYTLVLVRNYDDGGNPTPDLDTDDDGVIDVVLWDAVADSVAYEDDAGTGPTDRTYSPAVLVPGADGNPDEWEGASRIPDGLDTDTAADWVRNDPDGAGLPGFTGTPSPGEAISTMGAANLAVTAR